MGWMDGLPGPRLDRLFRLGVLPRPSQFFSQQAAPPPLRLATQGRRLAARAAVGDRGRLPFVCVRVSYVCVCDELILKVSFYLPCLALPTMLWTQF